MTAPGTPVPISEGVAASPSTGCIQVVDPEITGCDDHSMPDPDCVQCLTKYGYTLATGNRNAVMAVGMLRGRFVAGHSGNPNGRPKGSISFEAIVTNFLDQEIEVEEGASRITRREALARLLIGKALDYDRWALDQLLSRIYPTGGPTVEVNIDQAQTVAIKVVEVTDERLSEIAEVLDAVRAE